jgi:hypothetical protein
MNENKRSKIDEFRQFKKQIRGSTEVLVVGLDIGKRKHHAFLGSANGQTVLKGLIVENSAEGFAHLLTQVGFYMQRDGFKRVVFGLEPTSVYHKPLAEHLIAQGHLVVYATNEAIKKNPAFGGAGWSLGQERHEGFGQRSGSGGARQMPILRSAGSATAGVAQPAAISQAIEEAAA